MHVNLLEARPAHSYALSLRSCSFEAFLSCLHLAQLLFFAPCSSDVNLTRVFRSICYTLPTCCFHLYRALMSHFTPEFSSTSSPPCFKSKESKAYHRNPKGMPTHDCYVTHSDSYDQIKKPDVEVFASVLLGVLPACWHILSSCSLSTRLTQSPELFRSDCRGHPIDCERRSQSKTQAKT